jgi:hypothetical protein
MKRTLPLICCLALLLGGCISYQDTANATPTPGPDLAVTVSAGISATQTAVVEDYQPSLPYSPLELAALLVPGDDLDGEWQPSTVYDLTQPYPPMKDICGGYYGTCWSVFKEHTANFGAELELLLDGNPLGEAVLLYYHDLQDTETIYQAYQDAWLEAEGNIDPQVNELWMDYINPFQREVLGEKWLHRVNFGLWALPGEKDTYPRQEWELLQVRIIYIRCHMLVDLDFRFPSQNPWDNPEDNHVARAAEQEARFDLVYDYAREVDARITPYACNP